MATTYFTGTRQDTTGTTIKGQGTIGHGTHLTRGAATGLVHDDIFYGTDVAHGSNTFRKNVSIVNDRAPNQPSGYGTDLVPTYGDGKRNVVTTFTDDATDDRNAKFTYFTPSAPVGKKFSELT